MTQRGRRVLVMALRAIGDVVLITPILRLLRQRVPAAYLAVVADGVSAEVLRNNPHVDRIIVINRALARRLSWHQRLLDTVSLLKDLRAERFDIAVDLFSGPRSALLTWLCEARDRYGEDFRARGRGYLYNHAIPVARDNRHLVEHKLDIIRPLVGDVEQRDAHLELYLAEGERAYARETLARLGLRAPLLVGLIPGSGSGFRNWPADRFAGLGDQLERDRHARIILFGGSHDMLVCQRLRELMRCCPVDFSGQTSLRELMALFAELDLIISNVTGPMHLAVALNRPKVIGLYGAADTVQYAPWGPTGTTLTKGTIRDAYWKKVDYRHDFEYLNQISVKDVLDRVQTLIGARA